MPPGTMKTFSALHLAGQIYPGKTSLSLVPLKLACPNDAPSRSLRSAGLEKVRSGLPHPPIPSLTTATLGMTYSPLITTSKCLRTPEVFRKDLSMSWYYFYLCV